MIVVYKIDRLTRSLRDKVAASKKKGIWMGGCVHYGYKPINRKLVIQPKEAKIVKFIFEKYIEYTPETIRQIDRNNIVYEAVCSK